ncbi:MAG: class I SAM-dependent methyltransferase [Chitinophagia bacterium]|jgi:3'-phosphoadenosine 5'-phosphosulfate sulfotransferase (PAPS reductase)/FAD synthetase|nr:class I SAM-dependent methyltransferase [Chitinophagia bacterium]
MIKSIFKSKKKPHLEFTQKFNWKWDNIRFNRIALINLLCSKNLDGSYLEIGCQGNLCFDAVPMLDKIGVDPESGGTHKTYSDDFFAQNKKQFDVIFIDGLHVYDQVHRDVVNSLAALKPNGWIAIHDMLPDDAISEHVPNISDGAWYGDVWKVAFEIMKTPGIDFKIVKMDAGIGLVKKLNTLTPELINESELLQDKRFEYLYNNIHKLPIIDWEEAYSWIRN